ncbi:uncharacterized protein LOC110093479 isoform X4 [Dendrobium catenatum]|uniref:uncharacterized protein LOC110093479 isoform X4 n=1 Tax=Dendrobium catenatum TaxID=906689 RepID=UPI0009F31A85|nr:uncharacterized protein LOC110093479 isoform X4 [Dendrobium catenatum]
MKPLPLLSLSGALPSRSQALDRMNLRSSSFRSHKPDGMKPSYCPRRTITATDPLLRTDWIRMLRLRKSFERVDPNLFGENLLNHALNMANKDRDAKKKRMNQISIFSKCRFRCIGCSWLQV